MAEELEKTCENCKYEDEDMEGTHCRHCIHNAGEHFEPKEVIVSEQEIRAKVIDEFAEALKLYKYGRTNGIYIDIPLYKLEEIAEQLKAGEK